MADLKDTSFVIKRINMKHSQQVLDLIKHHYSGKTIPYKMLKHDLEEGVKFNALRALDCLSCGLSFGIFEKSTNRLVAVTLNVIDKVDKPFLYTPMQITDQNLQIKLRFIDAAEKDISQMLKVKKFLHFHFATIAPGFSGKNFPETLIISTAEIAQSMNCEYAVGTVTTSYYHRMPGMRILKEIDYSEYVDELTGTRPFMGLVIKPHTHARVLAYAPKSASKL